MKTFKNYITERTADAYHIVFALKQGDFSSFAEFEKYLNENYEMETLGIGHFSYARAAKGGKDFVLKVSKSPTKYEDDAWWDFAHVAQEKSKTNSLFPKVVYLDAQHRFEGDEYKIGIAILERLTPWSIATGNEYGSQDYDQASADIERIFYSLNKVKDADQDPAGQARLWNTIENTCLDYNINVEEVIEMNNILSKISTNIDIHGDNFGYRADGSLVIFDPLSWRY